MNMQNNEKRAGSIPHPSESDEPDILSDDYFKFLIHAHSRDSLQGLDIRIRDLERAAFNALSHYKRFRELAVATRRVLEYRIATEASPSPQRREREEEIEDTQPVPPPIDPEDEFTEHGLMSKSPDRNE